MAKKGKRARKKKQKANSELVHIYGDYLSGKMDDSDLRRAYGLEMTAFGGPGKLSTADKWLAKAAGLPTVKDALSYEQALGKVKKGDL